MSINTFEIQSAESDFSRHLALMNEFKNGVEDIEELETNCYDLEKTHHRQEGHNYENIIKSIFYKPLVLLAHPAGVEPATLSTANCASRYSGTDCNKQG